jgi:hypothetical protein
MRKKENRNAHRNPHSTPPRILGQLEASAAAILAEGVVLSSFAHRGLSGIEREEPVRRFLRTHLPGRFHVGQGAIASSQCMLEHQHDIIVADRDLCFMLLNTVSAQLLAIESIHAIVEVRSRDNGINGLAQCMRDVRALRAQQGLRQHGNLGSDIGVTGQPVNTVVIYQGPKQPQTLIKKLAAINDEDKTPGLRMPIDFVLVLSTRTDKHASSGYLVGYCRTDEQGREIVHHLYPQVGQHGLDGPKVICEGGSSFARWYAAVLHHLSGVIVYPPILYSYLGESIAFSKWTERPY